jgi:hypothetical protein
LSLIVGLALGAASVIALVDGDDVFGIFAANGLTKLVWGVAAAVLLVLALLPRVGSRKHDHDADQDQRRHQTLDVERPTRTVKRKSDPIRLDRGSRATTDQSEAGDRVLASGSGTTPASRDRTRGQRDGEL